MARVTFDDGDAYERFMGRWSLLAGRVFLDWLRPPPGLRWVDVGCGNGAFTELLLRQAHASQVDGIDPSPAQLAFARSRLPGEAAAFHQGSATALPFPEARFDAAAMALVIFFVPTPEAGVAEMVRVTRPGGLVAAYAWDIPGGGFPTEPVAKELRAVGIDPPGPPRPDVSTAAELRRLWTDAGLRDVSTHVIEVEREFASFDAWWTSLRAAPSLTAALDRLGADDTARLRSAAARRLQADATGRIRCTARANAVRGTAPGLR